MLVLACLIIMALMIAHGHGDTQGAEQVCWRADVRWRQEEEVEEHEGFLFSQDLTRLFTQRQAEAS